jgi:hypothetical protein
MRVVRHLFALFTAAVVTTIVVVLWGWLRPFTPTEPQLWSESSELIEYNSRLNILGFVVFSLLCFIYFFWNQKAK